MTSRIIPIAIPNWTFFEGSRGPFAVSHSVMDKKKTFALQTFLLQYISLFVARPNNPNGPYIIDGINNPEYAEYDGTFSLAENYSISVYIICR